MTGKLRIAIVGYGKIAQDQHVPSIAANPRFALAATVSRSTSGVPDIPNFSSHTDMLAAVKDLDAVAICTPPSVRYGIARDCIAAGLHALLEKPPGVSLSEVEELARLAGEKPVTLFTTWHAQHNPPVPAAAALLKGQRVAAMRIEWRENVRKWHPGQAWVWEPGGFGVFDPGINALSIATRIFPGALFVREAELFFPANKQAPIAANLRFESPASEGKLEAVFDWRETGGETWTIALRTEQGDDILLADGGARLVRNGQEEAAPGPGEYPSLYEEFASLIDARTSHVDLSPLRLAADAFLVGRRTLVEAFED
ncbi:MAG: Gfo/Idh/MocA family oxidoreductase [Alphaproteobacteria bacterium]|nr:Gfo/Idh/MocA family oxidoreductase [Alphaproteobacteria bacterium]